MRRRIGMHQNILEEQTFFKEGQSAKPGKTAKSELLVAMKGREWYTTPSIYFQRLLMGPKYDVATCVEELGSTKPYWRSKRISKRSKVPNLAQAAKLELLVAMKGREWYTT